MFSPRLKYSGIFKTEVYVTKTSDENFPILLLFCHHCMYTCLCHNFPLSNEHLFSSLYLSSSQKLQVLLDSSLYIHYRYVCKYIHMYTRILGKFFYFLGNIDENLLIENVIVKFFFIFIFSFYCYFYQLTCIIFVPLLISYARSEKCNNFDNHTISEIKLSGKGEIALMSYKWMKITTNSI